MKEVLKINPGLDPNNLKEGSSLTLPLGRLSARDRQILDGMRAGNYRLYPVRHGEKLGDILDKRSISMDEFQALNPDVNVNKVKGARACSCASRTTLPPSLLCALCSLAPAHRPPRTAGLASVLIPKSARAVSGYVSLLWPGAPA